MIEELFAEYLAENGYGIYNPDGEGGNIFLFELPYESQNTSETMILRSNGNTKPASAIIKNAEIPFLDFYIRGKTNRECINKINELKKLLHEKTFQYKNIFVEYIYQRGDYIYLGRDVNDMVLYNITFIITYYNKEW